MAAKQRGCKAPATGEQKLLFVAKPAQGQPTGMGIAIVMVEYNAMLKPADTASAAPKKEVEARTEGRVSLATGTNPEGKHTHTYHTHKHNNNQNT